MENHEKLPNMTYFKYRTQKSFMRILKGENFPFHPQAKKIRKNGGKEE